MFLKPALIPREKTSRNVIDFVGHADLPENMRVMVNREITFEG